MAALVLAFVTWVAAVGLLSRAIHDGQRDSRRQIEQRFEMRADIAARFVESHAQGLIELEQTQAERLVAVDIDRPRRSSTSPSASG